MLGDTKNVAAEHYVYALTDYREIDPKPALARCFADGVLRIGAAFEAPPASANSKVCAVRVPTGR